MNNTLPDIDVEFLESKSIKYEIFPHGEIFHIILKNHPIPKEHYNTSEADILIEIPAGYPNTPLDMFWTFPSIKTNNGNLPQNCEHHQDFHEKNWQRWSRHTEWRAGIDGLKSFIRSMQTELNKGI